MKTLMINDDAYRLLSGVKGKMSFSELLVELVKRSKKATYEDVKEFFGSIDKKEAKFLQMSVKEARKRVRVRI